VAWEPGQIAVPRPRDLALADVEAFCSSHLSWVVEGCYAGLLEGTLRHSPLLLFLEPGLEQCLENCRNRPWEPHKYPSKAEQDERLPFLLSWVAEYYTRDGDLSLKAHEALFAAYEGPKQRISSLSVPMMLFRVADTFQISGRGLVVVADVPVRQVSDLLRQGQAIEYRRPDGTKLASTLGSFEFVALSTPDRPFAFAAAPGITREDLPAGTEVWSELSRP
jgi:hypothetical protein